MGRYVLVVAALSALLLALASARGESTAEADAALTAPEMPTSEVALEPLAGEQPAQPFLPYASGAPERLWPRTALPAADRAQVDRLVTAPVVAPSAQAVYAGAAAEQFQSSMAALAEHELGLTDLASLGVVTTDTTGGAP